MKLRLIGISLMLALILGLMPSGSIAQRRERRDRDRGDRDRGDNVQTVYCESGDMRRHWCSEGANARVRLVSQRSKSRCIQGRTWGVDQSGIWVDRGCRADFEIRR
jgi:hypothetical protein